MPYPVHRARITPSATDTVTNLTAETAFVKKHTIKANSLRVNDVVRGRGSVRATATHTTDTFALKVKFGTLVVCIFAATDLADNDFINFEFELTVDAIGAGSTAKATFSGRTWLGKAAGQTTPAFDCVNDSKKTDSGWSTLADFDVTVTCTQSAADTGNIARLDNFNLEIVPAPI